MRYAPGDRVVVTVLEFAPVGGPPYSMARDWAVRTTVETEVVECRPGVGGTRLIMDVLYRPEIGSRLALPTWPGGWELDDGRLARVEKV